MARKRSSNGDAAGGILGLILLALGGLYTYLAENPHVVVLIVGVVVFCFWLRWYINKQKREAFLRWFYDRDRRRTELNADTFLNEHLTEAILHAIEDGTKVAVGRDNGTWSQVTKAFTDVWGAKEIFQGKETLYNQSCGRTLLASIEAKCTPILFRYVENLEGGYVFYVFPESVLVFVEGATKDIFVAAYSPQALTLTCEERVYATSTVVNDNSKEPIRFYDRYSPAPDAKILRSYWKVTNKDGSRSFRGGLKPENNPLHFELQFGRLTVRLGDRSFATDFSRYEAVQLLAATYRNMQNSSRAYHYGRLLGRAIASRILAEAGGSANRP